MIYTGKTHTTLDGPTGRHFWGMWLSKSSCPHTCGGHITPSTQQQVCP